MLPEVDRREMLFADWSEFIEALRKSVGVEERAPLLKELLREAALTLIAEGERSTAGLKEPLTFGERAGGSEDGVGADGEVERESPRRDCRSSPSDLLDWLDCLVGVAMGLDDDDDIVKMCSRGFSASDPGRCYRQTWSLPLSLVICEQLPSCNLGKVISNSSF